MMLLKVSRPFISIPAHSVGNAQQMWLIGHGCHCRFQVALQFRLYMPLQQVVRGSIPPARSNTFNGLGLLVIPVIVLRSVPVTVGVTL